MNEEKKTTEQIYREIYQHLCDAQELCEKIPHMQGVRHALRNLREMADAVHYSQNLR